MKFQNSDEFLTALSNELALHGASSDKIGTFLEIADDRPDWKKLAETAIDLRRSYEVHVEEHPDDESFLMLEAGTPATRPRRSGVLARVPAAVRYLATGLTGALAVGLVWLSYPTENLVDPASIPIGTQSPNLAMRSPSRNTDAPARRVTGTAAPDPAIVEVALARAPLRELPSKIQFLQQQASSDGIEHLAYLETAKMYVQAPPGQRRVSRDQWRGFVRAVEKRFDDDGYCDASTLLRNVAALLQNSSQPATEP